MKINPLTILFCFVSTLIVISYIDKWFNKGIETRKFVACANNPTAAICKELNK